MSKYYIIKDPIPNISKMFKTLITTKKTPPKSSGDKIKNHMARN